MLFHNFSIRKFACSYSYSLSISKWIPISFTQLSTGDKFTEIGYIYPTNYKNDSKTIYSYVNDVPYADLVSSMKKSAESSIYMLVWDIDKWLEKNTDLEISDFGFTDWVL